MRLRNDEQRKVLEKKSKLRGRRERIGEDLTWRERRMKWLLEKIAREEQRKEKKVWVRYGRIRIDKVWWKWNEEEEIRIVIKR